MSYAPPPGPRPAGPPPAYTPPAADRAAPAGAQAVPVSVSAPLAMAAAPVAPVAAAPASAPIVYDDPTALPPGWITQKDDKTNRWYFVDTATNRVTWDDPRTPEVEQAPIDPALRQAEKERMKREMDAKMAAAHPQQYAQPVQYQQPPVQYQQQVVYQQPQATQLPSGMVLAPGVQLAPESQWAATQLPAQAPVGYGSAPQAYAQPYQAAPGVPQTQVYAAHAPSAVAVQPVAAPPAGYAAPPAQPAAPVYAPPPGPPPS